MRNVLTILFIIICQSIIGETVDFDYYKKEYPKASYITIENKIKISYFNDAKSGELKARSSHQLTLLALEDEVEELDLVQIPFSMYEKVNLKSARYYTLDSLDEKVLKENIKVKFAEEKDYYIRGVFYNDLKVIQFSPTTPVKEKTLLVYRYDVIYNDLKFLNRFYAQKKDEIVEYFSIEVNIPENVTSEVKLFNIKDDQIAKSEHKTEHGKTLKYEINKLDKYSENYSKPPPNYYLPHFVILTKSYLIKGKEKNILSTVGDLYAWYYSLIKELSPDYNVLRKLSEKIISDELALEEKIKKIFNWVQNNISYIAFENGIAGFKPEEAQNVASHRYGDCKGMANLLAELLRINNIKAYHTWIGTRSLPYDYSIPSIVVDNHMICTVLLDSNYYFLDPTDKITEWNKPSSHIQGKTALIGKNQNYELVKVPVDNAKSNKIEIKAKVNITKLPYSDIVGVISFSGLEKDKHLGWYSYSSIENKRQACQKILKNYISDFIPNSESTNWNVNDTIKIPFSGKLSGTYSLTNDKMYLFCDIYKKIKNVKIDSVTSSVYFRNKQQIVCDIEYILPENLSISSIPDYVKYKTPDNKLTYEVQYRLKDNVIHYHNNIIIDELVIGQGGYNDWKEFVYFIKNNTSTPLIIKVL